MTTLTIIVVSNYGTVMYYVGDPVAWEPLLALVKSKTLTERDVRAVKELGLLLGFSVEMTEAAHRPY